MKNVLLVEDDQEINKMEQILLKEAGYDVYPAYSGTEALLLLERMEFQIVLLDLMLPGIDGESVLEEIKKKGNTPVICISAKDDVKVRVELIRQGADDYLVKPFNNEELLVRMEAVLRRNNRAEVRENEKLTWKGIELDGEKFQVLADGEEMNLTKREFLILQLLMTNPSKVFTKNNIFESVWEECYVGEENTVNVHISNIRTKLAKINPKEEYIQTVWGIGFKMSGTKE